MSEGQESLWKVTLIQVERSNSEDFETKTFLGGWFRVLRIECSKMKLVAKLYELFVDALVVVNLSGSVEGLRLLCGGMASKDCLDLAFQRGILLLFDPRV